ncbi:hypothetical protein AXK59_01905 [Tsukamurella tyrosinosolvens]|nr:hypothetical protein AXK59_01905 [Tsukamurella tyrosinosolvens]
MVSRPASVIDSYVEREYDELAGEQLQLWAADGLVASRGFDAGRRAGRPVYKSTRRILRLQDGIVGTAGARYLATVEALGSFRRRPAGAKATYYGFLALLLGGDVAGQTGAALSYGESPYTAVPQAIASGGAAVVAGMCGREFADMRAAARRQRDPDDLPEHLVPWAHLFRSPDRGKPWALLIIALGFVTALAVSAGIFWLRALVEGAGGGAVYGLLSFAVALASMISSYFAADEVADQIDAAEKDYARELKRTASIGNSKELITHGAAAAEGHSLHAEHDARGEAAAGRLRALKWRVLSQNPGVFGHGLSAQPEPPIGRRTRREKSS